MLQGFQKVTNVLSGTILSTLIGVDHVLYVKVEEATGKVEVLYNSTHTNHCFGKEECKYLPLSKSVQTEMQQKFSMGITLERIMDGMFYIHSFSVICNTVSNTIFYDMHSHCRLVYTYFYIHNSQTYEKN